MFISKNSPLLFGLVGATAIERGANLRQAAFSRSVLAPQRINRGALVGCCGDMVGASDPSLGMYVTESNLLDNLESDVIAFQAIINNGGDDDAISDDGLPTETTTLYKNGLTQAQIISQLLILNQNATLLNANWKTSVDANTATEALMEQTDTQRLAYGKSLQSLGGTFNNPETIDSYAGGIVQWANGEEQSIKNTLAQANPFGAGANLTTAQWIMVGAGIGIITVVAMKVLL